MNQEHAFPSMELDQVTGEVCAQHFGMSLRDYFAAKALIALLAIDVEKWPHDLKRTDSASAAAYEMADAMLKAREE